MYIYLNKYIYIYIIYTFVKIFLGLTKKTFCLRAIVECSLMQQ